MKFKKATIDVRFSRESGVDHRGLPLAGETFVRRYIQDVTPHVPVRLVDSGPHYAFLEIRDLNSPYSVEIDGEMFLNGAFVYAFEIDGVVKSEYTRERFLVDGFYYLLEYRFLNRENS